MSGSPPSPLPPGVFPRLKSPSVITSAVSPLTVTTRALRISLEFPVGIVQDEMDENGLINLTHTIQGTGIYIYIYLHLVEFLS